jgi:hypothetical protein
VSLKDKPIHSSEKRKFESALTNFLQSRFGLEFAFFMGKGQEKPYGYSCIDHKNKVVYKGGEIMKLEQLINPGLLTQSGGPTKTYPTVVSNHSIAVSEERKSNFENNFTSTLNTDLGIDDIIADIQKQIEQDLHHVNGRKKKGKKRDFL